MSGVPVKPDRIPCEVMGCKRTAPKAKYPEGTIIICGKCWRLAPKRLTRRIRRVERIGRKLGIDWDTVDFYAKETMTLKQRRACWTHSRLFEKIVKAATEVKVGIG